MGMSMFGGKTLYYESEDDTIGLDTKVTYADQHGNKSRIDMRILVTKARLCVNNRDFFDKFISDVERNDLHIGFPVIRALNDAAIELGDDEAHECVVEVEE